MTMDKLIPCSSKFFQLFGVSFSNDSKCRSIVNLCIRTFIGSIVISNAVVAICKMGQSLEDLPMIIPHCLFVPALSLNYWAVIGSRERIQCLVGSCWDLMTPSEKLRIRQRDIRYVVTLVVIASTIIANMTYFTITNGAQTTMKLAGFRVSDEVFQDPVMSQVILAVAILGPFLSFFMFAGYWISIVYYTLIQYLTKEIARNTLDMVLVSKFQEQEIGTKYTLKEIFNRFKFYNDFIEEMNDCLSVIPLNILALDFAGIICCIAFVVVGHQYMTWSFIIFTFGFMVTYQLGLLYFAVKVACDAHDLMKKARTGTVHLLSSTPIDLRDETWSNLSLYLSKEAIPKATVWNMFKMKRTIILSFIESIIPFAVMIITTGIQYRVDKSG